LKAATALASTSHCMARRARDTFPHPRVYITPFGVDEQRFSPGPAEVRPGRLVIGTVKTLAPKYGIDTLIEAFALLVRRVGQARDLRLEITGSGPDEAKLLRMVGELGLSERVTFHGRVPHARIPQMLHRLDIFVALSRDDSESFGVAAVEAACCERAIVVSDVDGFQEVVDHERTGLIVPRDDPQAAAGAIAKLIEDEPLRHELGRAARQRVLRDYTWNHSVDLMIAVYREVAGGSGRSELAMAPRS
jgi:glycosyltransferase involved in cell wall biosynthesis